MPECIGYQKSFDFIVGSISDQSLSITPNYGSVAYHPGRQFTLCDREFAEKKNTYIANINLQLNGQMGTGTLTRIYT